MNHYGNCSVMCHWAKLRLVTTVCRDYITVATFRYRNVTWI